MSGHCRSAIGSEETGRLGKYRNAEERRTSESRMKEKLHVRFDAGGAEKVKEGLTPSNEISVVYSTDS
ncbi:hypothetical protein [Paenibacillus eucommiae]|uniref:Uncharacterized protein n=1 Tax=Paenibacillus eucommiae TaxID=1355755 RepID=A0ABS4IVW9_9BACL|nr:hypothetical protein [Paenibacillus eucommiae]MBP1991729.1 hypothetical protein [Paenibacillus eucommiae]